MLMDTATGVAVIGVVIFIKRLFKLFYYAFFQSNL